MKGTNILQVLLLLLILLKWKMLIYLILTAIIVFLVLSRPGGEPIAGVYEQPGHFRWVKHVFMFIVIKLNKRKSKNVVGNKDAGFGLKAQSDEAIMENPQHLQDHPLACDAVWFGGGNREGVYLVISGARRKENILESMVFVNIPGIGLLRHEKLPETAMVQGTEEADGWKGGGVMLEPIEPMKRWSISYEGIMVNKEEESSHNVKISASYTSNLPYFDFDSEMDAWTVARAMAREPWSREYFERLRAAHQNHYEQFGDVEGVVEIDGEQFELDITVMRDHTHGSIRDWKLLHRYCFHQFTTVSSLRGFLGVVSQPGTLSLIEMGWVYNRGEKFPVQGVTLQPWNLGEGGKDVGDFGFRFKAGGEWFDVQVKLASEERRESFFGPEWEGRVVERFCRYRINGEEGWGVSEWEYRNKEGRRDLQEDQD